MAKFSLPGSSFDELKKIIMAYANSKAEASLAEVASLAGLHSTVVSRNNKFLSEVCIVEGGQKKHATDLGRRLGRAIEHKVELDAAKAWSEAVQSNEPLSSVLTTVRIKGGMSEQELIKHILYVSEQGNTASNKTGARCVVDVLRLAGLLDESEGNFAVSKPDNQEIVSNEGSEESKGREKELEANPRTKENQEETIRYTASSSPTVTINIQVQIPEAQDAETYERIFAAMKNNLFPPKKNG